MPARKDAPGGLAVKMVQALRRRKERGETDPLPLEQLARLAEPTAPTKLVLAAVHPSRRAFSRDAVVARRDLRAPLALIEDLPQLAGSSALLRFLLEAVRTASNHASSLAELKKKLTGKLQGPFQEAITRQIADATLPEGIGWVLVRNSKKLFLLSDLHTGRTATREGETPAEPRPQAREEPRPQAPAAVDFATAFDTAFATLDRAAGLHNFVSLVELRRALPAEQPAFDAGLRQLRLTGRYTLHAAEGRHGVSPEEQEAGVVEDGSLLLYVSRRCP